MTAWRLGAGEGPPLGGQGGPRRGWHRAETQGWPFSGPGQWPALQAGGRGWGRVADLDLELHLLLDADHLLRAAHLPDTLVARFHHLEQEGGHVRHPWQPAVSGHILQALRPQLRH